MSLAESSLPFNDMEKPEESSNKNTLTQEIENSSEGIWLAPDFDPIHLTKRLHNQLAADGGAIEQSFLFWEHTSAMDWYTIAMQSEYQGGQPGTHYPWIANEIGTFLEDALGPDKKNLEVVALGPGHAESEICLVRELIELPLIHHVRINLLDISQPLLALACHYVGQAFQDDPRVSYGAIQGDFHNLRQYKQLLRRSARRPCLVIMVGATLQTLQNEALFIQNSLGSFKDNDLLLVEISNVAAPVDRPHEIMEKDPRLSGKLPKSVDRAYQKFLEGPLRRFYQGRLKSIQTESVLELEGCSIPKSYGVNLRTKITLDDGTVKEFSLMRFMRYTKNEVIRTFYSKGWSPVCNWDFGPQGSRCAYLFRKRAS